MSLTETLLSWLADAQVVLGEEDAEAAAEEVQALIAEARSTLYYFFNILCAYYILIHFPCMNRFSCCL